MRRDKNMEIATFRYKVIADIIDSDILDYGEKEKLLDEKSARKWNIPYSQKQFISKSTIKSWITAYKKGGRRLDVLSPKTRKDKGEYKKLNVTLQIALRELREEFPHFTVMSLIQKLRERKIVEYHEKLNISTVYRFLQTEKLQRVNKKAEDRRSFEAPESNMLWQSDVMHGPYIKDKEGRKRKSYLIILLDDYSRLITHAEFFFHENIDNFKISLKQAILKRGIPRKLYTDNGSLYRTINLEQICALLGIHLIHAKPYTPQGKGKVERLIRYIRDSFLSSIYERLKNKDWSLKDLNEALEEWVHIYNTQRVHTSTKETPIARYGRFLEKTRRAPKDIDSYFRVIEFRSVKKDRTIQLNSDSYEVSHFLIGRKVECRYPSDEKENIEIFFQGKSFGKAVPLKKYINAHIGRGERRNDTLSYQDLFPEKEVKALKESKKNKKDLGGKLFTEEESLNA
jgi:transposase InsO family protein